MCDTVGKQPNALQPEATTTRSKRQPIRCGVIPRSGDSLSMEALMRLQGKLALVTGGSDGIGLAIGEALLREGAELCIVGQNPDKLARVRDHLGTDVKLAVRANLATADGIEEVAQKISAMGKSLDVLINNAAVADVVPFDTVTREQYDYALSLNLAA